MPSYKDEKTGRWYCKFYYRDWTGKNRPKKKMGFNTKRESKEWERTFLEKHKKGPDMMFESLTELYLEDCSNRLEEGSIRTMKYIIEPKILPFFGDKPVNAITAADIRNWQNELLAYRSDKGEPYSQTYLRCVNSQLSAIFIFGMNYYGLSDNPVKKAGSIGKIRADEMQFWTKEEFDKFDACVNTLYDKTVYTTLYYTGMRIGELLALTKSDVDLSKKVITVNKTLSRVEKKIIISKPKTPKSNREIAIPDFLCNAIFDYECSVYKLGDDDRIFAAREIQYIRSRLKKYADEAGVKRIRIHDLRHSHASLLIELGFSPLLIATRLGHENISTTLNIYGHLYPHKQGEVVTALEKLHK